jgi:hypothetical protein
MNRLPSLQLASLLLLTTAAATANPAVDLRKARANDDDGFRFRRIPAPAVNDAAATAKLHILSGRADPNAAPLEILTDGKIPEGNDEPRANFFFANSPGPKRLRLDLAEATALRGVATYSWHNGSRAPQSYRLFAATGSEDGFQENPSPETDPAAAGWTALGSVNTADLGNGGQHAAAFTGRGRSPLGTFRHLLFDISPNEDPRGFGNTFFSEIDVLAHNGPELVRITPPEQTITEFEGKGVRITLDSTASPDLLPWFQETAIPAMLKWYPEIVSLIAIPGETPPAPTSFRITLREGQIMPGRDGIPGFASGDRIVVSSRFMRDQKDREALGCLIHEMVHIVQFGAGQRAHRSAPSWFYEGATDYIRWFLFEPEKNGAVIRQPDRARYNDSYRVTANFFDWVIRNHAKDLLAKAHIAIHKGYSDDLWEEWTGKPVAELEAAWKEDLQKRLQPEN